MSVRYPLPSAGRLPFKLVRLEGSGTWNTPNSTDSGITGTLATTNANDTLSAAGTTTVLGALAKTNANDTSSAAGTTTVLGTLARTNSNDTSAAAGTTTILGTLAKTNANDTLAASGSTGQPSGTVAYTNANDTLSASGTTTVIGTLARTNANDIIVSAGWAGIVTGTLAYTNANDTCVAAGTGGPVALSPYSGGFADYGTLRERMRADAKEDKARRQRREEGKPEPEVFIPEVVRARTKKTITKSDLIGKINLPATRVDTRPIERSMKRKKRLAEDDELLLM